MRGSSDVYEIRLVKYSRMKRLLMQGFSDLQDYPGI